MVAEFEAIIYLAGMSKAGCGLCSSRCIPPGGGQIKVPLSRSAPEGGRPHPHGVVDAAGWRGMCEWAATALRPAPVPDPLVTHYPTGSWSFGEQRDYHICLDVVPPGRWARRTRLRAPASAWWARARAAHPGPGGGPSGPTTRARPLRIHQGVAHYSGQARARRRHSRRALRARAGPVTSTPATARPGPWRLQLRRGVRQTRAPAASWRAVVEGGGRRQGHRAASRPRLTKEDEMTLDTRSRRTVRLPRSRNVPHPANGEGQGGG